RTRRANSTVCRRARISLQTHCLPACVRRARRSGPSRSTGSCSSSARPSGCAIGTSTFVATARTDMLELRQLRKQFGVTTAVAELSLSVAHGEFLTLLGPSGCGKTTTLRMIAGFETPTSGIVILNESDITNAPPQKRHIGMVFQNYALFPHLTVFENV